MRILVTGGAGFIGSHLSESFLREGHRVTVVDNLSTGRKENVPSEATFYLLDLLDSGMEEVFSRERPEVISHCAAQIDVRKSVADPALDARINIMGTLNLLNHARDYGVHLMIFASSGGTIYGDEVSFPTAEDQFPRPKSPYGLSKYTAESYLRLHHELFGLNAVVFRYGNVYGPRQDPRGEAGVVAVFSQAILDERPVRVFGDGSQTRDYLFISDVIEANLLALKMEGLQVLNIGTGVETSVIELLHAFEGALGRTLRHRFEPFRPGELRRVCLDISEAEKTLGWRPQIPLNHGLKTTFSWFEQQRIRAKGDE